MSNKTDSNIYTVLFAVGMVVIVGALLAFSASYLKPNIEANKRIEQQQNILYSMGVNDNDETSVKFIPASKTPGEFKKYIVKQVVIEGDKVSEDDKAYLIDIKKEQKAAKEGKVRKLPLFIGEKDGNTFYIAPIRGKGLWDAIWGYIAMDRNMTIKGVYFDHKGETPGLGANINQRFFMDEFIGKSLISKNVFVGLRISKNNSGPKNENENDNTVDAIAGATITGDGVSAMLKSELALYVPYFQKLK